MRILALVIAAVSTAISAADPPKPALGESHRPELYIQFLIKYGKHKCHSEYLDAAFSSYYNLITAQGFTIHPIGSHGESIRYPELLLVTDLSDGQLGNLIWSARIEFRDFNKRQFLKESELVIFQRSDYLLAKTISQLENFIRSSIEKFKIGISDAPGKGPDKSHIAIHPSGTYNEQRIEPISKAPRAPYPPLPRMMGIQGVVTLRAWIDEQGNPKVTQRISGPELLFEAASNFVFKWSFSNEISSSSGWRCTQISIPFIIEGPDTDLKDLPADAIVSHNAYVCR